MKLSNPAVADKTEEDVAVNWTSLIRLCSPLLLPRLESVLIVLRRVVLEASHESGSLTACIIPLLVSRLTAR